MKQRKRILLIVEGQRTEGKIFKKIFEVLNLEFEAVIFVYQTVIYDLYRELTLDDDLDLLLTLKSAASNERDKLHLSERYAHVYLIFDFDPHATLYDENALIEMMTFFYDSTANGMLYINYPMVESYRHIKSIPSHEFLDSYVDNIKLTEYKQLVHEESGYRNYSEYTFPVIANLIGHHLVKAMHLTGSTFAFPLINEYDSWITRKGLHKVLHIQLESWRSGRIWILNTSMLMIVDLIPKTFFQTYRQIISL